MQQYECTLANRRRSKNVHSLLVLCAMWRHQHAMTCVGWADDHFGFGLIKLINFYEDKRRAKKIMLTISFPPQICSPSFSRPGSCHHQIWSFYGFPISSKS